MGCADSKSTSTKDSTSNAAPKTDESEKQEEEAYVTTEDAEQYVESKLGVTNEKAKKIVAGINKNDDGKIAQEELTALWNKIQEKKAEIRPYFEELDTDKSGFITQEEALKVLQKIFQKVDEKKLQAVMKRFDSNSDGKINYDEFVIFFAHIHAKRDEICKAVNELEKDENGAISADDIVTLISGSCGLDENYTRALVDDFDLNNDGKMNSAEFDSLMRELFP